MAARTCHNYGDGLANVFINHYSRTDTTRVRYCRPTRAEKINRRINWSSQGMFRVWDNFEIYM